jgi:type I restriction enzyme S subunit
MSSEWDWIRLGDCCLKIGSGATPTGGKDAYLEHGPFMLIRSQNVYNDGFKSNGLAFISNEQAKKLDGVAIEANDVLLNITGDSVARVCLAPTKYLPARVNQHVAIIRPKPALFDSRFIRYFLVSPTQQDLMLGLAAAGATRNALTKVMIEDFKVPCPPLSMQSGISDILSNLDDRITLLRETNATLEAIAQALFKSWFVDFDPVHAKAQGIAPEGMDEATAALFPDSFEELELGLVPKGWSVTSVSQVAEVVKGKSYSSSELAAQHDTALVTLKSFARGGGFRLDGFKPYTGKYKPNQVVVSGDLIVAYTDVTQAAELIGKPAIVVGVEEYKTLVASLDVGIVRPEPSKCNRQFLYGLFRTEPFQSHTFAHTSGTTVLHLAKEGIGSFQFPCPPVELIVAYAEIAEAIVGRSQTNIDLMRTLATLRDTLLPRLISGQLRLPEAEVILEEAVA